MPGFRTSRRLAAVTQRATLAAAAKPSAAVADPADAPAAAFNFRLGQKVCVFVSLLARAFFWTLRFKL